MLRFGKKNGGGRKSDGGMSVAGILLSRSITTNILFNRCYAGEQNEKKRTR